MLIPIVRGDEGEGTQHNGKGIVDHADDSDRVFDHLAENGQGAGGNDNGYHREGDEVDRQAEIANLDVLHRAAVAVKSEKFSSGPEVGNHQGDGDDKLPKASIP